MTITSNMRGVQRHPISEAVMSVLKEEGYNAAAKVNADRQPLDSAEQGLSEAIEQLAKVKSDGAGKILETLREAQSKLTELRK